MAQQLLEARLDAEEAPAAKNSMTLSPGSAALAQVARLNAQVSSDDGTFAGKAGGRLTEMAGGRRAAVATPQAHRGRW